jgi:hypothetical protein
MFLLEIFELVFAAKNAYPDLAGLATVSLGSASHFTTSSFSPLARSVVDAVTFGSIFASGAILPFW